LTGLTDPTDCVAKALAEYKIKLTSITYTSGSDSVFIELHYIINIKITLTHDSELVEFIEDDSELIELFEELNDYLVGSNPSGMYTGEVKVLGNDATIKINVLSSSSLDFYVTITGLVSAKIDCKG